MGMLKVIEWSGSFNKDMIYRYDLKRDYITNGSKLTVREGQAVIFCDKGKMADVFLPGYYTLDTNNIPLLTKLMSWKYGFESPFKSDVFYINTTQFTGQKWGTMSPIIIRDADYGAIQVRGYGTYSFKVSDPYIFMTQVTGVVSSYKSTDITDYLKSKVIMGISDAIGESKIPILDMAANLMELGGLVKNKLADSFGELGLQLVQFNFENFSLPKELDDAFKQAAALGMLGKSMHVYTAKAQADALLNASKNPGMAGATMGAGMGLGLGVGMGNMMSGAFNQPTQQAASGVKCSNCNANMAAGAKFCPNCGQPNGTHCPKCKAIVKDGAKFCPECGSSLAPSCKKCGASLVAGAKFCPDCGQKQ